MLSFESENVAVRTVYVTASCKSCKLFIPDRLNVSALRTKCAAGGGCASATRVLQHSAVSIFPEELVVIGSEEPCSHRGTVAHYSVRPPGAQLGGDPGQTQNSLEELYLRLAWERLETPHEVQESINGLHNRPQVSRR